MAKPVCQAEAEAIGQYKALKQLRKQAKKHRKQTSQWKHEARRAVRRHYREVDAVENVTQVPVYCTDCGRFIGHTALRDGEPEPEVLCADCQLELDYPVDDYFDDEDDYRDDDDIDDDFPLYLEYPEEDDYPSLDYWER